MSGLETIKCELTVIGTGMAGMASALFAANRGLSIVQVGTIGGIVFASGLLDLMGIHPIEEKKCWQDPWAAIDAMVRDIPKHPYARVNKEDIRAAFEELLLFLEEAGLPYCRQMDQNSHVITPLGTLKTTYCVPQTMWNGVKALEERGPCLLVDFHGLKDFSALQIVSVLQDKWPGLRASRVPFPDVKYKGEVFTGDVMARTFGFPENRERLARFVRPHVKDARAVGMPAMCGMERSNEIIAELEAQIEVPVFEIPTLPVSVPGLRLMNTFEKDLPTRGGQHFFHAKVLDVHRDAGGDFVLGIGNEFTDRIVRTKGIILATGRFLGKGLYTDKKRIRETLFDLPVHQPADRKEWHCESFLDPGGHPANRAGLEIDDLFRPLDNVGRPAFQTLFAVGSILAHQDWIRMKCGSGLAIATAYGAIKAFLELNE
jgi:glycerol-3-phosphate dehydrogenase subunit B